ncbi:MAG: VCBS repeat-containing protein, partial [Bacteroidetes bacterium]|nr:VCBS repeat-containing protein [Bacteroidota bacterium]
MKRLFPLIFMLTSAWLSSGQTPEIMWWYDVDDSSFGNAGTGDIDNDGYLEIVFGCYRNDSNVYALNAEDGSLLWKNNLSGAYEGCNDAAPLVFDIDKDGFFEVVVAASCNPKTYCFYGSTGDVKWVTDTYGSDYPPTVGSLNIRI